MYINTKDFYKGGQYTTNSKYHCFEDIREIDPSDLTSYGLSSDALTMLSEWNDGQDSRLFEAVDTELLEELEESEEKDEDGDFVDRFADINCEEKATVFGWFMGEQCRFSDFESGKFDGKRFCPDNVYVYATREELVASLNREAHFYMEEMQERAEEFE